MDGICWNQSFWRWDNFCIVMLNSVISCDASLTSPSPFYLHQTWYSVVDRHLHTTLTFLKHYKINIYSAILFTRHSQPRPIPIEAETWTVPETSAWLCAEVKEFLNGIFVRPSDLAERVNQLDAAHREGFHCRSQECPAVFPLHSSRVRYVEKCLIHCIRPLNCNLSQLSERLLMKVWTLWSLTVWLHLKNWRTMNFKKYKLTQFIVMQITNQYYFKLI